MTEEMAQHLYIKICKLLGITPTTLLIARKNKKERN